jgi:C-terminal processing protease CtpA/Prc
MKKLITAIFLLTAACIVNSCKKNVSDQPSTPTGPTASVSDLLKDSVYLYSKEVYLWHEVIPAYDIFNPRQYTGSTDLQAAQNVMAAIRNLQPQDKRHSYSFVTTKESSDGLQTGNDIDFGLPVKPFYTDKAAPYDSVRWFIEYVYDASPAGVAGVQRGWYIDKINGTPIAYDQASIDILNQVFYGTTNSASFDFVKPDGTTASLNLTKSSYNANSVVYHDVLNDGAKKVGYVVFTQFFGQPSRTALGNVISEFAAAGISDLVVDLRYNHGGSTQTQDTLANLIAPASSGNKVMYQYIFNDSLQAGKFPLLTRQGFSGSAIFKPENNTVKYQKAGSLNLPRVFFIVSRQTASASELLINNLRPYIDVKLVGDTTYGKPVGFFPIDIYNYAIYPISFKTVNSVGAAEYYDGFAPDKLTPDGITHAWGDVTEPSLASVLNYISTGFFRRKTVVNDELNRKALSVQSQLKPGFEKVNANSFTGMFVEKK